MRKLLIILTLLWSSPLISQNFPQNGIITYHPLDGNGNEINGLNNGVVHSAQPTTDRFGNPGGALLFDGINDSLIIPHFSGYSGLFQGDFTVSVWVLATNPNIAIEWILYKGENYGSSWGSNDEHPLSLYKDGDFSVNKQWYRTQPIHHCTSQGFYLGTDTLITNQWYNLVLRKQGTNLEFYANGHLIGRKFYPTTCYNNINGPIRVGHERGGTNHWIFNGKIDELIIYDRALRPCEIYSMFTLDLNSGMVARYPFSGNAADVSGNSNHGVVNGATLTTDRFGNPNSAFYFDGINDFIQVAHDNSLNFDIDENFTLSLWVNAEIPVNNNPTADIIIKWDDFPGGSNDPYPYGIRLNRTAPQGIVRMLRFDQSCGVFSQQFSNSSIIDNNWHHLVYMKEANRLKMIIDGVLINAVNDPSICNTTNLNDLYIGKRGGTLNPAHYKGKIDDIRIYNRPLNNCEIAELYQPGTVSSNVTVTQACISDTLNFTTNLDSAFWSDDNGNLLGTGSTLNFQFTNQAYVLASGNNFCGCLQTDTFYIQLKQQPGYNILDTFSICPGVFDTLPFSFNAGGSVTWSDGSLFVDSTALNPIIKPIDNSTNNPIYQQIYANISDNSSGCSVKDSLVLEVYGRPTYTLGSDSIFVCHKEIFGPSAWTTSNPGQFNQVGYVYFGDTAFLPPGIASFVYQGQNFDTTDRTDYFKILMEDQNGCHFDDSLFALTYARFFAEAGTDTFACSGKQVQIGEQNDNAYSYFWAPANFLSSVSTSLTTVSYPPDTIGWNSKYFIYKTDTVTGCTESDSVQVAINRFFNVDAGIDTVLCSQDKIQLGELPQNGFSYQWLGSDSISDLNISNPDFSYLNPDTLLINLSLVVVSTEDSTQCQARDTINVGVKAQIYLSAGPDLDICGSDSVPLGINNQKPYSFNWLPSNGITNPSTDSTYFSLDNFTDSFQTFEYFLNASFDGCSESDSIIINLRPKPFDDLSGPRIVCPGVDSAEYFVGRPFTDYSYNWFIDGGNISVNNNDSVVVAWDSTNFNAFIGIIPVNGFGCVGDSFIWDVRINPLLIPEIDKDTLRYCERDKNTQVYNILYPIVNSNYTWFVNGGQIVSGQGSEQVTVAWDSLGFGQIWVAEENITNIDSCFGTSDTLNVEVLEDPVLSNIQGTFDICDFGDTLLFFINRSIPGTTFWTSDSVSQIIGSAQGDSVWIATLNDGDFTLSSFAISNEGCFSDTISQRVNVRYFQVPEIEIDTNQICFWDSTDFTFRIKDRYDSSEYQWSSSHGQIVQGQGESLMTLRIFQPDTIQIFVTEINNAVEDTCFGVSDTIVVYFYPKPERNLSILGPDTLCFSQKCTWYYYPGWDNSTFYWSTDAGVCNTLLSYDSIELGFGITRDYFLNVVETSEYGCLGDTVKYSIEVFPNPETRIAFNDSIICPTDRNDRFYQVDGFDFSSFRWAIRGGSINYGQGSDIISVDWRDTSNLFLSVFEESFAGCTNDTVIFPLLTDNMQPELLSVGYDENFGGIIVNGKSELRNFYPNNLLYLYGGESALDFLASQQIDENQNLFNRDSIFGQSIIYYRIESINACNDTVHSGVHNNIVLRAEAEEELNLFKFEWNAYEAWNGHVSYKVYERINENESKLVTETESGSFEYENPDVFFEHCFYILAENTENDLVFSRSNLVCLEFLRELKIPDVVTANGDGFNDKFVIENIHLYPEHRLEIYNRSGRPVFKSSGYQNNWPEDNISPGVYFFRFKVGGNFNEDFAGFIHLLR